MQLEKERNYKLEIHYLMIVGRFFQNPIDFINLIKVNSKFNYLLELYKFNPISDVSLFEKMETQYFYKISDFNNVLPMMYRYKYFGQFTEYEISKVRKVNKKSYKTNEYDETNLIKEKCISIDISYRHLTKLLSGTPLDLDEKIYDTLDDNLNDLTVLDNLKENDFIIEIVYDDYNNSIGFLKPLSKNNGKLNTFIPTLLGISYMDSQCAMKTFKSTDKTFKYKIRNDLDLIYLIFDSTFYVTFQIKDFNGNENGNANGNGNNNHANIINVNANIANGMNTFTDKKVERKGLYIKNNGLSQEEFSNLMFGNHITCSTGAKLSKFLIRRHVIYKLKNNFNDDYYNILTNNLFKSNLNVLLDTWKEPLVPNTYNLGYLRYVYIDNFNNVLMYNVLPTQIIITSIINGNVNIFKPKANMIDFINTLNDNVYFRYNFRSVLFHSYYNLTFFDIIKPLKVFNQSRLLICTNSLTRCSCVNDLKYFVKVKNNKFVSY